MANDGISPRIIAAGVTLLGLAPPAVFLVYLNEPVIALSLVSVVVLAASLFVMFGPAEGQSHAHTDEVA